MDAHPRAVLVEPAAQPWPLADQRLVGDFGGTIVERDEPRVREALEQFVDAGGRHSLRDQLVDRHASPRVRDPLAELGHAQEQAARQLPLRDRQRVDDGIGGVRDGRRDAAALAVALDGQRATVAPLPGGTQRMRQQR